MANRKTISERIVDSAGTGKSDPVELTVLDDLNSSASEIDAAVGGTFTSLNVTGGTVILAGLPTADPGVAGQLYLATGVLTVSTGE